MSGKSEQLSNLSQWGGSAHLVRRFAVEGDERWSAFNPSVQVDENGTYWMVFRSSNCFLNSFSDVVLTTESRVRNRLFIGQLDTNTMKLDELTIKELDMKRLNPQMKRGIEDARLYFDGKRWCLSATHLEKDAPRASLAVLSVKSLPELDVLAFNVLEKPNPLRIEKNWMPVHKVGTASTTEVDFMYDCNTALTGTEFHKTSDNQAVSKFRGGSPLIPLEDGTYLAVIHETFNVVQQKFNPADFSVTRNLRHYSHRFVRFNQNFQVTQATEPFVFLGKRIEFASGLAHYQDGFIVSFGSQDLASYVATISSKNLFKQLKDLP